jgi:hypothetical protein
VQGRKVSARIALPKPQIFISGHYFPQNVEKIFPDTKKKAQKIFRTQTIQFRFKKIFPEKFLLKRR